MNNLPALVAGLLIAGLACSLIFFGVTRWLVPLFISEQQHVLSLLFWPAVAAVVLTSALIGKTRR